ncbi:MAG: FadR family transcriptional regulator [Chloroflexi bacterium]|nr:FadR family transcriptional regulator [Chloroflexota bacterium]
MSKLLRAVKRTRISEDIVDQIYKLVRDGALKPGDRLPPERELAQQLNVSRASVREAIRLLDVKGLVVIKPGAGTFIVEDSVESIVNSFASIVSDPVGAARDVFEMRLLLEPHVASLAAERASRRDIEQMKRILDAQEADIKGGGTGVEFDSEFHFTIARATKNAALIAVTQTVSGILSQTREDRLLSPERSRKSLHSHREILTAIEQRDPHEAEEAMHCHIADIDREVHDLSTGRLRNSYQQSAISSQ